MAGGAGSQGAQPSPSAPPSPPEPVGLAPAYPPPTGPAHGKEYPSDEDGDGPYETEVEGAADAEVLVMGGRAASVASGGADTEGRTGRGHVNLADVDGITLTTAGGVEAQLDAETLCNESDRPPGSVEGSSTSTPPPSP